MPVDLPDLRQIRAFSAVAETESFTKAAESDDIADAVDYKGITKKIIALVEKSDYFLIERMAEEIAQLVLEHPGVREVEVTVDKPGALRFARSVAVQIHRR